MRRDFQFGLGAIVIAMALFYWWDHTSPDNEGAEFGKTKSKPVEILRVDPEVAAKTQVNKPPLAQSKPSSSAQASEEQMDIVYNNFANHLRTVGGCLEIQNATEHDKVDPTFDNLIVSLRPALGDFVVEMDDWVQTDYKAADGTLKRVRTEMDYQDATSPVKHLQVYKINEQGMPELQDLDEEQSRNPSEGFIQSLSAGLSTTIEEKGGRIYYQDGEELVIVERNGKIESFSLTRNGKTVSCTGMDAIESNCQCLE